MQILHITAHLGGGAGKAIVGMSSHKIRGVNQQIILLDKPEKTNHLDDAIKEGVDILIAPDACGIKESIKKADVVILNWWDHPLMAGFLAEFPDVECRLAIWNHINGCTYPYLPYAFLEKFDKIMFTSKYSYDNQLWSRIEKHNIWNNSEIVFGMGDYQPVTIMPKFDYEDKNDFIVGYVGTLNYGKISEDFILYCEKAAEAISNIKFVLVGDVDAKLKNDIRKSKICNKFVLAGFQTDVEKYYHSFDVFGYLLNKENYATTENSLLEAMAYGLPIVVLDNKVEINIIKDGINGYTVRNMQEYADELWYLRNHSEERQKIGKNARKFVMEEYSEEKNFNKFYLTCLHMLKKEKTKYKFDDIIGKKPFEWFLYFAHHDGDVFRKYIEDSSKINLMKVKSCKPIFKEEAKSSVIHFARYYEDDCINKIKAAITDK